MFSLKTASAVGAACVAGWWLWHRLRQSSFSFAGKLVLITGGSRGLGLVIARQLTKEGARVVLCVRDSQELLEASEDLAKRGCRPSIFPCDVTKPEQVRYLIDTIQQQLGPVDVVINNAGIIQVGPLSTMTRQDFEEAIAVSFWGAFNTIEAVLPTMRYRQEGRIVNISSIGGKISVPHLLPYCVGKFALVGYSQGLRAELANNGVTVTTVCPGLMRTGSPPNALFKGQHRAEYAWFSISDSLPLLTISAEHAASDILSACRRGDAEVIVSLPAKLAVTFNALFPETTASLLSMANRLLPRLQSAGPESHLGKDSESAWSPSFMTTLTEQAAARNNELAVANR